MRTNLLKAIINLANDPITDVVSHYKASNRANNMGDALEFYIKDLFCGTISETNLTKKNKAYNECFSYLGNQNNPPDIIIKNSDAIEVKKIESPRSALALNSSYPKDKLYADSSMITTECRECEKWDVKDIIYTIGVAKDSKLTVLWFIYGDCYAAGRDLYKKIKDKISTGLEELNGVELSETNELGRVTKVDPLGITTLRIRGMWQIENPIKVFDYVCEIDLEKKLNVNAIVLTDKFNSFPKEDIDAINKCKGVTISDIKIKDPNNSAKLKKAKIINYSV